MESERYKATRELLMAQKMAGVMLLMVMVVPMSVTVAVWRQSSVSTHREHGHQHQQQQHSNSNSTEQKQLPISFKVGKYQKTTEYSAGWFSVVKVIVDIDSNVFLSDEIIDIWYVETLKPLSCLLSLYQILHIKIVLAWLNLGFVEPRDFICIVKSPLVWLQFISFREWKFPPT